MTRKNPPDLQWQFTGIVNELPLLTGARLERLTVYSGTVTGAKVRVYYITTHAFYTYC